MDAEKVAVIAELAGNLQHARSLRQAAAESGDATISRLRLRSWQATRLARTYADLLQSERFGAAAEFFLSDLYGPKDFSARDADIVRLVPLMARTLPLSALQTISRALELDALSENLDAKVAAELCHLGVLTIDGANYAAAYRSAGERPLRERQIALIEEIGRALERLTRKPLVRGALRAMRKPAQLAGMATLQEFLERGFNAFQMMGNADEFLQTVCGRETQLLVDLFSGEPSPQLVGM